MSRLTDLIAQVARSNPTLADDLRREVGVLSARRPFGLNFERHLPESVQLPERRVRRGDKVVFRAPRGESDRDLDRRVWVVTSFEGKGSRRKAILALPGRQDNPETTSRLVSDVVVVAEFRDPIYPGLQSTGKVERGGNKPYHIVINGENYHVLEALTFAYGGLVDCIYIDPPYNTRDKDWKYNNDYVDSDDAYRHSKWLAMMERRLKIAKELLNPADSVLIVTIDEREYLRLGLLLEQVFPEGRIEMVTSVISAKGVIRQGRFARVEEFIFFVAFGAAAVHPWNQNMLDDNYESGSAGELVEWIGLRRREPSSVRGARPNQFYAIFVHEKDGSLHSVGEALADEVDRSTVETPSGTVAIWPLKPNGTEMLWGLTPEALRELWRDGMARVNNWNPRRKTGTVQYLPGGTVARIRSGDIETVGFAPDGSIIARYRAEGKLTVPKRVWNLSAHNAETGGTNVLSALIKNRRFPYPKSLYAVEDTLRFFIAEKTEALVLDFFSGSGTTAHAVARLNKQDAGRRRSICVTNNEVAYDEAKELTRRGLRPGDSEWEALGICEYITKPRVQAAITGQTPDGEPIKGDYKFTDKFPLSDGFEENAEFFDLTYEDPERVKHGLGFDAVAPLLWMKAGSEGRRIEMPSETFDVSDNYAVLFGMDSSAAFLKAVRKAQGLRVAFIVTDDETQFQVIAAQLPSGVESMRLYSAYLDTFRIGGED